MQADANNGQQTILWVAILSFPDHTARQELAIRSAQEEDPSVYTSKYCTASESYTVLLEDMLRERKNGAQTDRLCVCI